MAYKCLTARVSPPFQNWWGGRQLGCSSRYPYKAACHSPHAWLEILQPAEQRFEKVLLVLGVKKNLRILTPHMNIGNEHRLSVLRKLKWTLSFYKVSCKNLSSVRKWSSLKSLWSPSSRCRHRCVLPVPPGPTAPSARVDAAWGGRRFSARRRAEARPLHHQRPRRFLRAVDRRPRRVRSFPRASSVRFPDVSSPSRSQR